MPGPVNARPGQCRAGSKPRFPPAPGIADNDRVSSTLPGGNLDVLDDGPGPGPVRPCGPEESRRRRIVLRELNARILADRAADPAAARRIVVDRAGLAGRYRPPRDGAKACANPAHQGPALLPAAEFYPRGDRPGGLTSWCKPCIRRANAARAARAALAAHAGLATATTAPARVTAARAGLAGAAGTAVRPDAGEAERVRDFRRYRETPGRAERQRQLQRDRYHADPQADIDRHREWYEQNRDRKSEYDRRRYRARKRAAAAIAAGTAPAAGDGQARPPVPGIAAQSVPAAS